MATLIRVITRDLSTGRYHKRYGERQKGFDRDRPLSTARRVLVDERCNLDQAGAYEVVKQVDENAPPELLCDWCFPMSTDFADDVLET